LLITLTPHNLATTLIVRLLTLLTFW